MESVGAKNVTEALSFSCDTTKLLQECNNSTEQWNFQSGATRPCDWTYMNLIQIGLTSQRPFLLNDPEHSVRTTRYSECDEVISVVSQICPDEEVVQVRFMKLKAGCEIFDHTDIFYPQGLRRFHVPVVTNPNVIFTSNGTNVNMPEGSCFFLNVNNPHSVKNDGSEDRIHLVIDCVARSALDDIILSS